jgi:arabinogalactan oligomer/maltooligosaccharide transport system substrate-binding protein
MNKLPIGSSVLIAMLALTGCQTIEPTPPNEAGIPTATQNLESIEVWADRELVEALNSAAEQFAADYQVTINVTQKEFFGIEAEIEAGLNPPDLFAGSSSWVRSLSNMGLISPIQSSSAIDFQLPALRSLNYQGNQFGYPYSAENIALICHTEKVSSQPNSWAQVATKDSPLSVLENGDPYSLYALQSSFGAKVFLQDELGDYLPVLGLGTPAGVAFASWLSEQKESFKMQSSDLAVADFLANEANCLLGGPWLLPQLGDYKGLAIYDVPKIGEFPATSFLSTRGFFISEASTNKQTAELFLSKYLTSLEFQKLLYLTSGQQPATEAFIGDIDSSMTKGFISAANTAVPLPALSELSQVWFEWGAMQSGILGGAKDPGLLWDQRSRELASNLGLE